MPRVSVQPGRMASNAIAVRSRAIKNSASVGVNDGGRVAVIRYFSNGGSLRRAHLGEEAVDGAAQHARLVVEFACILQHLGGRGAGRSRRSGDAADMGADLARPGRCRLDVAGNLARRIALLLD